MSQRLINRNDDLRRLRNEGYCVRIVEGYLVVDHVPYVAPNRELRLGSIVSCLQLSGDKTSKPTQHVAMFAGEHPCDENGKQLVSIVNGSQNKQIGPDLVVSFTCSRKPSQGYEDYFHKMSTYCELISSPARKIDPSCTARAYIPVEGDAAETVFRYLDTASSRAGITAVTEKLKVPTVAIVGLGGTGGYVLDLVSKTPVGEIHLFDGDRFFSHNAFRAPGAATLDALRDGPMKVAHYATIYSQFRRGIVPHECNLDAENLDLLDGMHSVFLCMDGSGVKEKIIEHLESCGIPFIDCGIGVDLSDEALGGIVRVTTSTPEHRDHVRQKHRIPFGGDQENPYDTNIQVADLNALNACLAVIRWKKVLGFYRDFEQEHHALYTIDGNTIANDDLRCAS